ncbi:hypothetical protein RF11_11279 [Thelohanellus kitauei]|uniref:Uncharacterized protein n=1 Tax=Thelohanellus kitauei TaxID=669202 RepID=A0A0C2MA45_THEKT|nr:hypothetical protein RF11_11279 [Thelohanellus kitauei]
MIKKGHFKGIDVTHNICSIIEICIDHQSHAGVYLKNEKRAINCYAFFNTWSFTFRPNIFGKIKRPVHSQLPTSHSNYIRTCPAIHQRFTNYRGCFFRSHQPPQYRKMNKLTNQDALAKFLVFKPPANNPHSTLDSLLLWAFELLLLLILTREFSSDVFGESRHKCFINLFLYLDRTQLSIIEVFGLSLVFCQGYDYYFSTLCHIYLVVVPRRRWERLIGSGIESLYHHNGVIFKAVCFISKRQLRTVPSTQALAVMELKFTDNNHKENGPKDMGNDDDDISFIKLTCFSVTGKSLLDVYIN